MQNILEYKGYHTKIEYDHEDACLRGKIEGIRDLVTFESSDPERVEQEFHDAVDDYLIFCEEVGKRPEKEFKGSFNVRISPNLHRELTEYAYLHDISLNATVEKAISSFLMKSQTRG